VADVTAPMAKTLKAKGFTKEQINEIAHAMYTVAESQKGPPLKTVVIGDDGNVYVRVALPDPVFGPIPHWRVIDIEHGDANTFSPNATIEGKVVYQPEEAGDK
jgi:hypothetical protein